MRHFLVPAVVLAMLTAVGGAGFYGYRQFLCQADAVQSKSDDRIPRKIDNSIGMKFVLAPAGEFVMGSPSNELHRDGGELQHEVAIGQPFYIGVFEVTQSQYEKVMVTNPSYFSAGGSGKKRVEDKDTAQYPVERVSWDDAVEFCKKLSVKESKIYRLPTEAEWEYACRADTKTVFNVGNDFNSNLGNINGLGYTAYGKEVSGPFFRAPVKVGEYKANALGLFDMHGNVQEWCADWYEADYYKNSPKLDPRGPKEGTERVVRGGAWPSSGKACRSAARQHLPPDEKNYTTGFRVVLQVK